MKKAIYVSEQERDYLRVYQAETKTRIAKSFEIEDKLYTKADVLKGGCLDVEYIFSTWGMTAFTVEEIKKYLPSLKAIFYAAGSVQHFAKEFLDCGVKVFSAWMANAMPVAEYAVQIILANKGFYQSTVRARADYFDAKEFFRKFKGNYDANIGILGDGAIGSMVIERLLEYKLNVFVYSITMTEDRAKELGVTLCSLEEIFSRCDVISNHLANNPQTVGMINRKCLSSMPDYATFINTGRGAQVDETALIEALEQNPTRTAVLDVTYPEPPEEGSKLYTLPNVFLTPHIAGSAGNEVRRMAEYMAQESENLLSGNSTKYEVTKEMLRTMA